MKKIKKLLKILLIFICILCSIFFICMNRDKTHADAGYHSSYSSGGGRSSSSSSSSSSSRQRDRSSSSSSYSSKSRDRSSSSSDYSSSSSSSSGNKNYVSNNRKLPDSVQNMMMYGTFAVIIGFFIFEFVVVFRAYIRNRKPVSYTQNINFKFQDSQTAIKEIKKYIPEFDRNDFLSKGYDIFVKIEEAWMNFDLDSVRDCITDEMFNMYESQLMSMKMNGEQNIMNGFKPINYCITDAIKQNNMLEIKTMYSVEFYDYIINQETKKVVRGNSRKKIKMVYEFTFIKDVENAKLDKCPNCGAPIDMNSGKFCTYCGSKLVDDSKNFVMSKKISLSQQ